MSDTNEAAKAKDAVNDVAAKVEKVAETSAEKAEDAAAKAAAAARTGGDATAAKASAIAEATAERVAAAARPRVQSALRLVKEHPLGAVATVAAATAFIEVELAVGLLTGIGATALLAGRSGPATRQEVLSRGKWALDRARGALTRRKQSGIAGAASAAANEASPPPPA
jgi:ElaB/YqjD/DUF883 family membrane-anchored ribosome-binding protein